MKNLPRIFLAFLALLVTFAPARASGVYPFGVALKQQNNGGTITVANTGTTSNPTPGSAYFFTVSSPGPVTVTFTVQSGSATLHFYSRADGVTTLAIPDAAVFRQDNATYGAPAAGTSTTYYFNAPSGQWGVIASAFSTNTAFQASWNALVPVFPGQGPESVTPTGGDITNGNQKSQIVDASGSPSANVIAGDKAGLLTNSNTFQQTFTLTGAQSVNAVLGTLDTNGYTIAGINLVGLGTGVTNIRLEGGDNVNGYRLLSTVLIQSATIYTSSLVVGGVYSVPLTDRYLQVQLGSGTQTTGTTTVVVTLRANTAPAPISTVSLGAGTQTIGGLQALASGGCSSYAPIAGLTSGALTQIKASGASWYGHNLSNPNAATVYVNFYNAASITYGTTVPIVTVVLNAIPTATAPFSSTAPEQRTIGVAFSVDLYYTVSTSLTTLTAPASPILGTIFYI